MVTKHIAENVQLTNSDSDILMNGGLIQNLGAPESDNDAARKAYVDSVASGLRVKGSVIATGTSIDGTAGDITLSGTAETLDGVSISADDRVLLRFQSDPIENGIWVANAGSWTRPADFNTGDHASGSFCFVEQGTAHADEGFVCTTNSPTDVIGTNTLDFTQFSEAGEIVAGTGLTKTGSTINAIGGDGITANADDLAVDLDTNPGLSVSASGLKIADELAGNGLTIGSGIMAVGAGTGITVNANDVAIDFGTSGSKAISATILASTSNGEGASLLGIEDSGTLIEATTIEGALAENRTAIDAIEDNGIASSDSSLTSSGTIGADSLDVVINFGTSGAKAVSATVLASTSNGEGASLISIEDSGGIITAVTVEAALAENRGAIDAIEDNGITGGSGVTTSGTIGADDLNVSLGALTGNWDAGNFVITAKGLTADTDDIICAANSAKGVQLYDGSDYWILTVNTSGILTTTKVV